MNPPEAPRDHFLAYKTKGTKGAVAFELRLRLRSHDRYEDGFFDARQPRDLLVPVAVDGLDMLIGL